MRIFIITITVLLLLDAVAKIVLLAQGNESPRDPRMLAIDVVGNLAFSLWAVYLLA